MNSLAVKDIEVSRRFYEKFGFKVFGGDLKNILTFNPGWDSNARKLASFTDVDSDGNPILVDQHV